MFHRAQESKQAADGTGTHSGQRLRSPARSWADDPSHAPSIRQGERRETRDERTLVVMRNHLTVIRGQAQLIKRALASEGAIDARSASDRLDAIITSVDDASMELHHLQSSSRTRPADR